MVDNKPECGYINGFNMVATNPVTTGKLMVNRFMEVLWNYS